MVLNKIVYLRNWGNLYSENHNDGNCISYNSTLITPWRCRCWFNTCAESQSIIFCCESNKYISNELVGKGSPLVFITLAYL
jgi:hypothetical protein